MVAPFAGAAAGVGGAFAAATSGWSSPTGISSMLLALVGAGTFVWSIYRWFHDNSRTRKFDAEEVADLIDAITKSKSHED
jgi:hypothetical protein